MNVARLARQKMIRICTPRLCLSGMYSLICWHNDEHDLPTWNEIHCKHGFLITTGSVTLHPIPLLLSLLSFLSLVCCGTFHACLHSNAWTKVFWTAKQLQGEIGERHMCRFHNFLSHHEADHLIALVSSTLIRFQDLVPLRKTWKAWTWRTPVGVKPNLVVPVVFAVLVVFAAFVCRHGKPDTCHLLSVWWLSIGPGGVAYKWQLVHTLMCMPGFLCNAAHCENCNSSILWCLLFMHFPSAAHSPKSH